MPLGGLQDELDYIMGRRMQRYWVAYLLMGPAVATWRFFDTLNKIESKLNENA